MTQDPARLPYKVVKLATDMFAGASTGFSGPELHNVFANHTDVLGPYAASGGGPSRWQIFQTGLYSLTLDAQRRFLLELCEFDGPAKYGLPPEGDVARLRALLLADTAPGAAAAAARLADLEDWKAVQRAWDAALAKIVSDPEGAITAARTALESVCKHICEERVVRYESGWDLAHLYKATAHALEIAPDQHSEQIIKQILSGVATMVEGLGGLRNALSDAHGRGKMAARPAPRHAKLAVNAAFAVAGFLIDTHVEKRVLPVEETQR